MKRKYTALKMYLVGMTVGLFIWGWSAIAQQDNTANQVAIGPTTSSTTIQTSSTNRQTLFTQPRIRTRTS